MKTYKFTIDYYEDVPDDFRKPLKEGFDSIAEAATWVVQNNIQLQQILITQYYEDEDQEGVYTDTVSGVCNLEEASVLYDDLTYIF